MSLFTGNFLKRIHYHGTKDISFLDVPHLMEGVAYHIPFENLDIIQGKAPLIDKEFLYQKIILNHRGGLCYELNPLYYYVLEDLGFCVHMVQATINSSKNTLQHTHIATVLEHQGNRYLVDVGFGANQALQPVPFTGEIISTVSGDYRVRQLSDKNNFVYEKFHGNMLAISYTFRLEPVHEREVNRAKELVTTRPESPFNKGLLMTKTTEHGHKTLTDSTFTVIENQQKVKKEIDESTLYHIGQQEFNIDVQL